jgi:RHS repeat-associated protein
MGNVVADTAPGNRVTQYGRDGYGRISSLTPAEGATQTVFYNVMNSPDSVSDGVYSTEVRYVRGGDSALVIDQMNQVYRTDYNAAGWVSEVTDPTGKSDEYEYNLDGLVSKWTNREDHTVNFTYDVAGRPLTINNDSISYNTTGWLITAWNATVRDSTYVTWRGQPRLEKRYFPGLNKTYVIERFYDYEGVLDSTTASGPSVTFLTRKYDYDEDRGTLDGITFGSNATTFGYADDFALEKLTYPGNRVVDVDRTSLNFLAATDATASYSTTTDRQAGYDDANRVTRLLHLDGSTGHFYAYDDLGRLVRDTTVTVNSSQCTPVTDDGYQCTGFTYNGHQTFTYDSVGNRTDLSGAYGTGNRITSFAGCPYTTDDDGNVKTKTCGGITTTYNWNSRNQLVSIVKSGTTTYVKYDASGRIAMIDGPSDRYFLWDGDDLLAELNSIGGVEVEYSYYPGMDNLHAVKKHSNGYIYYAHEDAAGNVIALTSGSTAYRTYQYSPWGGNIGGNDAVGFSGTDRARFKGALFFAELGGLYFMRNRGYDPVTGRFLSEDPIGLAGGINLYAFAGADPVNGRDPSGLQGPEPFRCPEGWYHFKGTDKETGLPEDRCVRPRAYRLPDINVSADLSDGYWNRRILAHEVPYVSMPGGGGSGQNTSGLKSALSWFWYRLSGQALLDEWERRGPRYERLVCDPECRMVEDVLPLLIPSPYATKIRLHPPHHTFRFIGKAWHYQMNLWIPRIEGSGFALPRLPRFWRLR